MKPPLLGIDDHPRQDQAMNTSGQVINLNMNNAFKCVPHILGNLHLLQTAAELCANAHYNFAHSSNSL